MSIWFRDNDGEDLISLSYTAQVLNVRLQRVIKLGLPRYMAAKKAAYKKKDIEALLVADITTPNALLRELQAEHRQVQIKQKAHPSTKYRSAVGTLPPEEAKAVKQESKENRKKPLTKDELFRGWNSSLSLNRPVQPPMPMTEFEVRSHEASRVYLREIMTEAEAYSLEKKRARLKENLD
jgi:hypothetical protein